MQGYEFVDVFDDGWQSLRVVGGSRSWRALEFVSFSSWWASFVEQALQWRSLLDGSAACGMTGDEVSWSASVIGRLHCWWALVSRQFFCWRATSSSQAGEVTVALEVACRHSGIVDCRSLEWWLIGRVLLACPLDGCSEELLVGSEETSGGGHLAREGLGSLAGSRGAAGGHIESLCGWRSGSGCIAGGGWLVHWRSGTLSGFKDLAGRQLDEARGWWSCSELSGTRLESFWQESAPGAGESCWWAVSVVGWCGSQDALVEAAVV